MLAVKNCWALTANQLNSFVQFLPLCLYLPAVAGEFYCRHRSARLAPAPLESPARSPELQQGAPAPRGQPGHRALPLFCTPGKAWLSVLLLYFWSWSGVILSLQPAKCPQQCWLPSVGMCGGLMEWFLSFLIFPNSFMSKKISSRDILSENPRLEKLHRQKYHFYVIRIYSYIHNPTSKKKLRYHFSLWL